VCPTDSRRPLQKFGAPFSNSNLSYFVGFLTNDSFPQMFLSGDRNLTGGINHASGIVDFPTNSAIAWGAGFHKTGGNIGLADGSVQQLGSQVLRAALRSTGDSTNRLSMP
jgi:prepilin-type processing-associated H-X9-DG protein